MQRDDIATEWIQLSWARLHSALSSVPDFRSRGNKFEFQLAHITFMMLDREIIYTVISPTSSDSRMAVVSYL